jgi:uncharacterized protein (TIGR03435 family)
LYRAVAILVAMSALAGAAQAQAPAASGGPPTFEVASVKRNLSGERGQSGRSGTGAVTMTNMRVRALLVTAYGIRPERIIGAPSWIDEDRFDIAARASEGTPDNQLSLMLRTLLADRFRLAVHTETQDQPVYALVTLRAGATLGPNLKPSTECDTRGVFAGGGTLPGGSGSASSTSRRACGVITGSDGRRGSVTGGARTIDVMVRALQGLVDRPVVNRTGLAGTYDFDLYFAAAPLAADAATGSELPSIFTAVQEQLGLRLEAARGAVEFLAVDRIEHPTPD